MSSFNLPIATLVLLAVNCLVHTIVFVTTANLGLFSIATFLVIDKGEYYRILTSAFVHGGLMHIGMNMMSLVQLLPSLESQFGTLQVFIMSMWAIIVEGCLYVGMNYLLGTYLTNNPQWLYNSGVGYSGVLFTYAICESYHSTVQTRSVFGFCTVSSKVYPWLLLVLISLLLPNISFMGHLSGILTGVLIVNGKLQFLLPSVEFLKGMEEHEYLRCIVRSPLFSKCGEKNMVCTSDSQTSVFNIIIGLLVYICYVLEAILACVGYRPNLSGSLERFAMLSWSGMCSALASGISSCMRRITGSSSTSSPTAPWLAESANGGNEHAYRSLGGPTGGQRGDGVELNSSV